MKFCHLQVNGWNWRTSSEAKLARLRKPKISCSSPYADYRLKTNAVILLDRGHSKGEPFGRDRAREGNKNLNVVDMFTV
jgi:hypothetical protein